MNRPAPFRGRGARGLLLLALILPATGSGQADEKRIRPPVTLQHLERRKRQQEEAAKRFQSFHAFRFVDRFEESGIRFQHAIVDDAGKNYKAVHYDHGNGLAAADVDLDGHLDVYFTTQLGKNQLWRNRGNATFEDITDRAGVAMENQVSVAAAFGDIDNDGDPDLFVTTVRHGNRLFENIGGGWFKDISKAAGVDYSGHSSGAAFLDFDNDGRLDLFVANVGVYTGPAKGRGGYFIGLPDAFSGHLHPDRAEESILYRNIGGNRFENVSGEVNLRDRSWCGEAVFADLNHDRFPDLYLVNMQGDDHFFINLAGKSFADRTAEWFPKTPWGSMGARFFDFNNDGELDLFVTDMHSDMTQQQTQEAMGFNPSVEKSKSEPFCSIQWTEDYLQGSSNNIFGNALYLNTGAAPFSEISDAAGAETYWPWGPSIGDLNADGHPDLFITAGMGYPFRYGVNSVLLNEQGKRFYDAEFLLGVEPRRGGWLGKEWFTLDCSGEDKSNPLCAGKTGILSVPGSLSSRSSLLCDVDNDGDLDILTNEFNDRPQVLVSTLSETKPVRFLKVQLAGSRSNRDGIGAVVRVHAGSRTWLQYHDGKSGYLGQSSMPLYFGLGEAERVDAVEVLWPSGIRQEIAQPEINSLVKIAEPDPSNEQQP